MKITIIKSNHVTKTELIHLKYFLESGMIEAKANTKQYEILDCQQLQTGYRYKIRITTKKRNDYNKLVFDHQTIILEYTK